MRLKLRPVGRHQILTLAVVVTVLALVYWALIPTVVARQYLDGLDKELANAISALHKVASSATLPMFLDPDVSLAERQKQIGVSAADVKTARQALDRLGSTPHLAALPANGIAGSYRAAKVTQARAKTARSQAGQTLTRYSQLLRFLQAYTGLQMQLDRQLGNFNEVMDFNGPAARDGSLYTAAGQVKIGQKDLGSLLVPADFIQLRKEAASTFSQAAVGFEDLSLGLKLYSDFRINNAANDLEEVTYKNQVADKNLLVGLADKSPILLQLAELPEKAGFVRNQ